MVHSVPATLSAPVDTPTDAVPECWEARRTVFPYVVSIRDKTHKVDIGYPEEPRGWRTVCGWAFGMSVKAKPVLSLPACHEMMCEKCFGAERKHAIKRDRANVLEVGKDAR